MYSLLYSTTVSAERWEISAASSSLATSEQYGFDVMDLNSLG